MRNLKLAFRTLFKTPFVTVVAILSLALGIGANAAIFSLFNEMLLAPLPVSHPEQLVNFGGNTVSPGSHQCGLAGNCDRVFSYKMFRDLEAEHGPFTGVAAHMIIRANVAFRGQTLNTTGELVSGSYFPVLVVRPTIGRLLGVADDRVIGGHPVVVVSYGYWQTQLSGDPAVLGQQIVINGQSLTIIGVSAPGFEGTTLGNLPDFFIPLTMRKAVDIGWNRYDDRRTYWAYIFARLKPGVSVTMAKAQVNVVYHRIINDVESPLQQGISAKRLELFKAKTLELDDGRRGLSTLHDQTRMPLILLFSITGIVLAIACANIANLLLARAANRSLEMVVRLSLGATRRQLLAQLLTESVLLAALGGVAGLAVAYATLKGIVALLPANVASSLEFGLSGQAIVFAGALSMVTGLLFGLFPALHSTRPNLATTLRDNSGKTSSTRSATRFRSSLVTAQIALSMALLVSAGLFIKSLAKITRVDLGIQTDEVVTFHISPALNGYSNTQSSQFFAQMEEQLAALPGVRAVTTARVPVLANNNWDNSVSVQGFAKTPDTDDDAYFNAIGPNFFKLLGQPLVSGREFTAADVVGAPKVAVVNEEFARKFGIGREAVGKMMGEGDHLDIQIVGLVRDAKYSRVKDKIRPVYYLAYKQDSTVGTLNFYVKSSVPVELLAPEIRSLVGRLATNLPIEGLKTLPRQIRDNVYLDRMISTLSAAFAALATLLAAIGLYGVLAYSVVQRTKEIGVRMALGASSSNVLVMILRQVAVMTVIGAAIGAAAAFGIGRSAASLLYDMPGHDTIVMSLSTVVLTGVALAAGYLPALRASRVDPMQSLRYE
jgi:predicted permease